MENGQDFKPIRNTMRRKTMRKTTMRLLAAGLTGIALYRIDDSISQKLIPPEVLNPNPIIQEYQETNPPIEIQSTSQSFSLEGQNSQEEIKANAEVDIQGLPKEVSYWKKLIEKWSNHYGVDPDAGAILVLIESHGDQYASSGVAYGLGQVTIPTAKGIFNELKQQEGYDAYEDFKSRNPKAPSTVENMLYDPDINIRASMYYYKKQLKTFGLAHDQYPDNPDKNWGWSVALAGAAYNGGVLGPARAAEYWNTKGMGNPENSEGWNGPDAFSQPYRYFTYFKTMWDRRHVLENFNKAYSFWLSQNGSVLANIAKEKMSYIPEGTYYQPDDF